MSALGSDGGGGLTSLQRPCLYQTVIRLILIREYLCLHPSFPPPPPHPPQATRQQEPWQLKNGKLSSSISRPVWWPLKKTRTRTNTVTHTMLGNRHMRGIETDQTDIRLNTESPGSSLTTVCFLTPFCKDDIALHYQKLLQDLATGV